MNIASLARRSFAVLASISVAGASVAADVNDNDWQFALTPYLWLPTISGDLNYEPPAGGSGGSGPSVDVGPTDWLDLLNGAALLSGSARKGRLFLQGDFVYLGLESEQDKVVAVGGGSIPVDASLNISTQTKFDGVNWSLMAGYALNSGERSTTEVFAGVRYLGIDVSTSWNLEAEITAPGGGTVLPAQGSLVKEVELTDGIIGIRGDFRLGDGRWSANWYLDAGTGSSDLTWQAMGGLEYQYDWGDLLLMYRHLDYEEGSDKFLENLALSGPVFGVRFRF